MFYIVIISLMVIFAIGYGGYSWLTVGVLLFMCSDCLIGL